MKVEHLNHTWACMQTNGNMGEIRNYTNLTESQIQLVTSDSSRAEEVCPGGSIVCSTCESPFSLSGETPVVSQPAVDFASLKQDLIIPTGPASATAPAKES